MHYSYIKVNHTYNMTAFALDELRTPGHGARSLTLAVISSVSYIPFRQAAIQSGRERLMEGGRERCQLPMTAPVDLLEPVAAGFSF